VALGATGTAAARPLLTRGHTQADRAWTLDAAVLDELRSARAATVEDFPLGDRQVELTLERVDPLAGSRLEVMGRDGAEPRSAPERAYFSGIVVGEPASRVLLIAGRDLVRGWVATGGTLHAFGPDAAGTYRVGDLRQAAPPPSGFCVNDRHPELAETMHGGTRQLAPWSSAALPASSMLDLEIAIDTDQELRALFPSPTAVLEYVADLVAATNVVFLRDVGVRLVISYVRVWDTTDPWAATEARDQLTELAEHWRNPANHMDEIAGPRDLVHLVSGKNSYTGIAWIDGVCDARYQFGVSQVLGSFDVTRPDQTWDVMLFAHEIGHGLGSPHTHCYAPPIDHCHNGEASTPRFTCYAGPTSVPPGGGSLMSYCHRLPPGLPNVTLTFHPRTQALLRETLATASCLEVAVCGDGTRSGGEPCDDGNTTSGDGCSAVCGLEACGNRIVDAGEDCDDGGETAGDGCSPDCLREACGNGIVDPGEDCDDGNGSTGDGCTPACVREPRCGDGVVDPGEQCDDGNAVRDDGCSDSCATHPCVVAIAPQTAWPSARVKIAHGAKGDRLQLRGRFGMPVTAAAASVRELRLLLQSDAGDTLVDVTLPGDGPWTSKRGRVRYKDPAGMRNGIRRVATTTALESGVATVDVTIVGVGGAYGVGPDALPLALTVLFDGRAGADGAQCGHFRFATGQCTSKRGGKRIVCR